MPAAPSFDDNLTQFVSEAQSRRPKLRFFDGDVSLAFGHGAGAMFDAVIRYAAQCFKETFFDGAKGAALRTLVADRTKVEWQEATAAAVTQSFTRASAAAGAGTIPAGHPIVTDPDGLGAVVTFTTDADVVWGALETGTKTVNATASLTGPAGNVAAATLVNHGAALFDTSITTTNAASAGGGNEEESDEELVARARAWWRDVRRGTRAALETGAKEVTGVRVATVAVDASGIVNVQVSDADGTSSLQMLTEVDANLDEWACAGDLINVIGNTPYVVDIDMVITAPGFAVASRAADFIAAVENRVSKLGAGETLTLDMMVGAVIAVEPDRVTKVDFPGLTDDIAGIPGRVIRTGVVTVS